MDEVRVFESREKPRHILVVDDEEPVRVVTGRLLSACGYHVTSVASGSEALAKLSQREFEVDLLLTDLKMPLMSGKELADRVRKISPTLPILFMSGYTDQARQFAIAADDFIEKPFNMKSLSLKIKRALEPSRTEPKSNAYSKRETALESESNDSNRVQECISGKGLTRRWVGSDSSEETAMRLLRLEWELARKSRTANRNS